MPNIRLLSGRIYFVQGDYSQKAYLSIKKKLTEFAVKIHFKKVDQEFSVKIRE